MADKKIIAKGFVKALQDYGDVMAERTKLTTDIMANDFKARQNFFWKMQEKKAEAQQTMDLLEQISKRGGGGFDYGAPSYNTAGPGQIANPGIGPRKTLPNYDTDNTELGAGPYQGGGLQVKGANVGGIRFETPKTNQQFRLRDVEVPQGYEVTGYDQKGNPMMRKRQSSALEKENTKTQAKIAQSKVTSQYNLNLTTEAARDLSDWLVKGYKEGGAGTKYGAAMTNIAAAGWLPPNVSSKFAASGAIVGKRNEVLMKMFPMLTQQIGKEGSVRLIESVIERIGQTLPDTHTPPALAREQLVSTIQSLYRISRALDNIDLNQLNSKNASGFADLITQETLRVPISSEEQGILDGLMNSAVEPIDKYLGKKQGNSISYSQENLEFTAQKYGISVDEVKRKLGVQ